MIKIVICVRNRLGITKKCIESIKRHTTSKHQIYIYDNLTNYRLEDHFTYFKKLYLKNIIQQYTVNSVDSTFDAFSKVVALNQFGYHHEMDPKKDKYDYLVFLDNDMIVNPEWDLYVKEAWEYVNATNSLNSIRVITQFPGGMKHIKSLQLKIREAFLYSGKLGGSGFWAVGSDFFRKVGFLDCKAFIGKNKKHDQFYWNKLNRSSMNRNYMLGIQEKLVIHAGGIAGSVCNALTREKSIDKKLEKVKFKEVDAKIEALTFDEFYNGIKDKHKLYKW